MSQRSIAAAALRVGSMLYVRVELPFAESSLPQQLPRHPVSSLNAVRTSSLTSFSRMFASRCIRAGGLRRGAWTGVSPLLKIRPPLTLLLSDAGCAACSFHLCCDPCAAVLFREFVLPFGILNEKRDLWFRSRQRFYQLFSPLVASAPNATAAMHILAAAVPLAQAQGALAFASLPPERAAQARAREQSGDAEVLVPGNPVSWHSEVSPAFLSPQQVVQLGGSCTGTGILFVAAARAVGVPARLAGCSESVVRGDDHHWLEYYDASTAGPFGDGWHTREGPSAGNADGPWDSPSGPMKGCLAGVVPGSQLDTLWASSWSASTFLPALWANSSASRKWAFVGGVNRCGAYCSAWGCGVNNSIHYSQAQCGPTA